VKVTQITRDHKPDDPKELSYIESVGGSVSMSGETARVNGILAISRSVGVKALQTAVRAEPEIFTFTLRVPSTLVVATDGVFDVLSNQRVGELSDAKQIVQYAFDNGARDNLAVALIDMQSSPVDLRDEL
jgi:serine/threonine protein phosphatase PrpC